MIKNNFVLILVAFEEGSQERLHAQTALEHTITDVYQSTAPAFTFLEEIIKKRKYNWMQRC